MELETFWTALKPELTKFIKAHWKDVNELAQNDIDEYLVYQKACINRWLLQLNNNEITSEEFGWLLESSKDLIELKGLKEKGLNEIALEQFTSGLFSTIVSTAIKLV